MNWTSTPDDLPRPESDREAGFPLYNDKDGKNSVWKMLDTFRKDFPIPMTATELMALHMSRDLLSIFHGTASTIVSKHFFRRSRLPLYRKPSHFLDKVAGSLKVDFGPTKSFSGLNEIVKDLRESTTSRKRVKIMYQAVSTGKITKRKVDPYQVWVMNGSFST